MYEYYAQLAGDVFRTFVILMRTREEFQDTEGKTANIEYSRIENEQLLMLTYFSIASRNLMMYLLINARSLSVCVCV